MSAPPRRAFTNGKYTLESVDGAATIAALRVVYRRALAAEAVKQDQAQ